MEDRDMLSLETGTADDVAEILKKFIDRVSYTRSLCRKGFVVGGVLDVTCSSVWYLFPLPTCEVTDHTYFF
jgi:hypothetical protein